MLKKICFAFLALMLSVGVAKAYYSVETTDPNGDTRYDDFQDNGSPIGYRIVHTESNGGITTSWGSPGGDPYQWETIAPSGRISGGNVYGDWYAFYEDGSESQYNSGGHYGYTSYPPNHPSGYSRKEWWTDGLDEAIESYARKTNGEYHYWWKEHTEVNGGVTQTVSDTTIDYSSSDDGGMLTQLWMLTQSVDGRCCDRVLIMIPSVGFFRFYFYSPSGESKQIEADTSTYEVDTHNILISPLNGDPDLMIGTPVQPIGPAGPG